LDINSVEKCEGVIMSDDLSRIVSSLPESDKDDWDCEVVMTYKEDGYSNKGIYGKQKEFLFSMNKQISRQNIVRETSENNQSTNIFASLESRFKKRRDIINGQITTNLENQQIKKLSIFLKDMDLLKILLI
jgi:hypothetical protein